MSKELLKRHEELLELHTFLEDWHHLSLGRMAALLYDVRMDGYAATEAVDLLVNCHGMEPEAIAGWTGVSFGRVLERLAAGTANNWTHGAIMDSKNGATVSDIARGLGVHRATVYLAFERAGYKQPPKKPLRRKVNHIELMWENRPDMSKHDIAEELGVSVGSVRRVIAEGQKLGILKRRKPGPKPQKDNTQ